MNKNYIVSDYERGLNKGSLISYRALLDGIENRGDDIEFVARLLKAHIKFEEERFLIPKETENETNSN